MSDNACEQFILPDNRYCEQEAVYHDETRGQAYCEAHAQAWQKWRGAEDMTGMRELRRGEEPEHRHTELTAGCFTCQTIATVGY